ncbi:MAG: hypothetical protein GY792_02350, partial [Gammaproteobacteria bacterium]|nr:hypothetical protein [Gammaproteobacteria bacterium]
IVDAIGNILEWVEVGDDDSLTEKTRPAYSIAKGGSWISGENVRLFNRFELGHKPAYIIGVSSTTGGAYPVTELRISSYKNNRLCYIPEHLIVRDCEKVFNKYPEENDPGSDPYYKSRLNWGLGILIGYGKALKAMRESTRIHHDDFGNGM